jgi:DNA-binding NarL/FixJ family response regulator
MSKRVKVAIADDHGLLRKGIIALLNTIDFIDVAGEMSSGEEAVNFAREHRPDLFLLDIMMRGMTGIEATRWIKEQNPGIKIILISSEVNKAYISAGIKSGIDGYLDKDVDGETLRNAIETVLRGERYFSPEITTLVFQDFFQKEKQGKSAPANKSNVLSKREEEVLILIAQGKSLKEVAEQLFISTKTVETHKTHIQDKLGLLNTAQLVRYAIEHKYIDLNTAE